MPAPAVLNPPASRTPAGQGAGGATVPFIRGTKKHREAFYDNTPNFGTTVSPVNIPAYGFLRGLWIRVDATGGNGSGTPAVASGDAPFNVFSFIGLFDVNGAPMYGPFGTGYSAFLIAKYGGYHRDFDARGGDVLALTTGGNFRFWMYIPVEINMRNGLGVLANLNAAATYKLNMTIAAAATVYSTPPAPTVPAGPRIRIWLDSWAQPPANDLLGNMVDQIPYQHGTTQYWSSQVYNVASGQQTIRLQRVGLYMRNFIFILRTSAGVRTDADWPDPIGIYLDGFELETVSQNFLWQECYTQYGLATASLDTNANRDTGVYVRTYADDFGLRVGVEMRNRYLTTLQSSRLELRGSFGANAASLEVLTNDISPAGDIFEPAGVAVL